MSINPVKYFLPVLLFLSLSFDSLCQGFLNPKIHLDVKVVLYKKQEIMDLKAIVRINNNGKVNELSFYDWLYYEKDGEKASYPEAQIDHLEFTDFDGTKRVFVSSRYTEIKNARGLWEILYSGKITWYREYYPIVVNGGQQLATRDFYVKNGVAPVFAGRPKKRLQELTADQPSLLPKIKSIKKDADILEILKIYNES